MLDIGRVAAHVHGHLGWLGVALLAHPAIVLYRRRAGGGLAVTLAAGVVTVASAMGFGIYGRYRAEVRQSLFIDAPTLGYLFERKEHLAFGACMLAYAGALLFIVSRQKGPERRRLRRSAALAFTLSTVLAAAAATMATIVASYRSI